MSLKMAMDQLGFLGTPVLPQTTSSRSQRQCTRRKGWDTAMVLRAPAGAEVMSSERAASLPWTKSVGGDDIDLLFMPFIEHQLNVMEKELNCEDYPFEADLSLQLSDKKVREATHPACGFLLLIPSFI